MNAAPALAIAVVGGALVWAATKKPAKKNGGAAPSSAKDRGLDAIEEAIAACPEHEGEILAAGEAFAIEVLSDPERALAGLEKSLDVYCPRDPLPGDVPVPGPVDDVLSDPGDLAEQIKREAARAGCENLPADLVRAFQRAAIAEGVPQIEETGEYDFLTAVAANMFVQGAPPPCRQPDAPEVPDDVKAQGEKWTDIFDELGGQSPGWP